MNAPKQLPEDTLKNPDIERRMATFLNQTGISYEPKHGSRKTCANKAHGRARKRRATRKAQRLARRAQRVA